MNREAAEFIPGSRHEYIIVDTGLREIECCESKNFKRGSLVKPDYKCINAPQKPANVNVLGNMIDCTCYFKKRVRSGL